MIKGIAYWTRQMMGDGCGLGIENFPDVKVEEVMEAFGHEQVTRRLEPRQHLSTSAT
jgi:hypothetical protein